MSPFDALTPEQFKRSKTYSRARRVQVVVMVTAPVSLVLGVSVVHFLVPYEGAVPSMLVVLILVAVQAAIYLVAEAWKTVAFGKNVYHFTRRVRSRTDDAPTSSDE